MVKTNFFFSSSLVVQIMTQFVVALVACLSLTFAYDEESVQYYYCGYQTFLNTPISVSKNEKFVIDMSVGSIQNISILSDSTSFQVDVTGCITPLEEVSDAIGIEIQYRNLPTVFSGAIQNLLHLKLIKMEHCEIEELMPGSFLVLPRIETILLRFNEIREIPIGIFNNLQVKKLILSYNNISVIVPDAFNYMPKLAVVELDNNKLKTWNTDWFTHSPNVEIISLNFNLLTSLPANAFVKLKNSYSTTIRLSNNKIIYIHPTAFDHVPMLYTLWLNNNNLHGLPDELFGNLERIYVLSLAGNKLGCLSDELLDSLKSPDIILRLEDNRAMDCDCLERVHKWARIKNLFFTKRYVKIELGKRKANGSVC